jgi:hypothetical protein
MWIQMKKHFEARSPEWFNGLLLSVWGSFLILNPGIFDGPAAYSFSGMKDLAPQELWGFGALVIGMVRLTALFINGQWGITPIIRVVTSFLSVFVWFWICVGLFRTGSPQTGMVIYPALMLADMFSAFRAASDAYEAEALKRLNELSEGSGVASIHRRRT